MDNNSSIDNYCTIEKQANQQKNFIMREKTCSACMHAPPKTENNFPPAFRSQQNEIEKRRVFSLIGRNDRLDEKCLRLFKKKTIELKIFLSKRLNVDQVWVRAVFWIPD